MALSKYVTHTREYFKDKIKYYEDAVEAARRDYEKTLNQGDMYRVAKLEGYVAALQMVYMEAE